MRGPEFAAVREMVPGDGPGIRAWIVETWRRSQRGGGGIPARSRASIRHLLERPGVVVRLALPALDTTPDADAKPFGWTAIEPWSDGSVTVHYVYVRERVPARGDAPASPGLRGYGIARMLLDGLGSDVWYTTYCPRVYVPSGWRFDPWR